jgi:flagellar M-ring protein FliF
MTAPFVVEKPEQLDIPIWRQPEVTSLAQSLAWPLGTLALATLVLLGFVKPAMKALTESRPRAAHAQGHENQLDALESEQPERPQLVAPSAHADGVMTPSELRMEEARKLTRDNPAAVANIVKSWINGEAPA